MKEKGYRFNQEDLLKVDEQVSAIRKSCEALMAFSHEKGGIPTIERNVERIMAPLKLLSGVSEVLEIVRED
jgi:hypothetical protein